MLPAATETPPTTRMSRLEAVESALNLPVGSIEPGHAFASHPQIFLVPSLPLQLDLLGALKAAQVDSLYHEQDALTENFKRAPKGANQPPDFSAQ
jgi:hypothetical protein